jgi:hypothetical protein
LLTGTGDPEARLDGAPSLSGYDAEPVTLAGASVLQVLCEIDSGAMCEMLPPALHPTLPPAVSWLVYDCPETPWGAMRLAQTRIECRSGTRPRGLLISAFCDNPKAAIALSSGWGFAVRAGEIDFSHRYDEVRSRVHRGGQTLLEIGLRRPTPLGEGDIQFVAGMHPAQTPNGFRLVQCDPLHRDSDAQRGDPIVDEFESSGWGDERIEATYPVSAASCRADITLSKLRFVCKPDQPGYTGTEVIGSADS